MTVLRVCGIGVWGTDNHMNTERYLSYIEEQGIGKELHYYCSINALEGIILKHEIWLRPTSKMNDRLESLFYFNQLYDKLSRITSPIEEHTCEEIFEEIMLKPYMYYPYAMCFSREEYNAAQWERYADDGSGFCVVFDTLKFMELLDNTGVMLAAVNYGDVNWNNNHLLSMIMEYVRNEAFYSESHMREQLIGQIMVYASTYKHRSFRTEAESRIIRFGNQEEDGILVCNERIGKTIDSVTKINLANVAEVWGSSLEGLIKSIVIGPRNDTAVNEAEGYLSKDGDPMGVRGKIKNSECPLR